MCMYVCFSVTDHCRNMQTSHDLAEHTRINEFQTMSSMTADTHVEIAMVVSKDHKFPECVT